MRGGRHLPEQPRVDIDAGDEHIDGVAGRGRDCVLTLDEEQAELVAPAPLVQLPDELQPLVVPRDDHVVPGPQSSHSPWKSKTASHSTSPPGKCCASSA